MRVIVVHNGYSSARFREVLFSPEATTAALVDIYREAIAGAEQAAETAR
jgi:hypothetical protein